MLDATFQNARDFLSKYLPQTRLVPGGSLSGSSDQNVYLKLENELPTGAPVVVVAVIGPDTVEVAPVSGV